MCKVSFYTNDNMGGDESAYNGPTSKTGLPTDVINGFDSLKTYDNSYLIIYDENNYQGCNKKYYPNQSEKDLAKVDTNTGDNNWKNDVRSFRLYDQEPASWKLGFDQSKFQSSFSGNYDDSTLTASAFGYQTQDASYRIYKPTVTFPDENSMVISTQIDNKNLTTDDHLYLSVTVNLDGSIGDITYSADYADGKTIPKAVIGTVDIIIALVAVELAVESVGGSLEVGATMIEDFNKICKYYNDVIEAIQRFSDVDGGKFYLTAVGSHALARISNCITKS